MVFASYKWTWLDWISSLSSLYVKCERVRQLKMVVLGTLCPTPRNLSEQHYLLLCFGHKLSKKQALINQIICRFDRGYCNYKCTDGLQIKKQSEIS